MLTHLHKLLYTWWCWHICKGVEVGEGVDRAGHGVIERVRHWDQTHPVCQTWAGDTYMTEHVRNCDQTRPVFSPVMISWGAWPDSGLRRWPDAEQSMFMHQVMVTWRVEIDTETIRCRGTFGQAYQTRPVVVFHFWTLIGVDWTLAGQAPGRVGVHPVSMLRNSGRRWSDSTWGASDQVVFVRVRASRWAPTVMFIWTRHVAWKEWSDAVTGCVRSRCRTCPDSAHWAQWRGNGSICSWGYK
jgi:hypothetical protein